MADLLVYVWPLQLIFNVIIMFKYIRLICGLLAVVWCLLFQLISMSISPPAVALLSLIGLCSILNRSDNICYMLVSILSFYSFIISISMMFGLS